MKLLKRNTLTDVSRIGTSEGSEGLKKREKGDIGVTHWEGGEVASAVSRTNKVKATSIPMNIEYIKNPITKVIVVNSKPSRGEKRR